MFRSWKFVTSSSISCPSATTKPNEDMISVIAAIVSGIGCSDPSRGAGPGVVASTRSRSMRSKSSPAERATRRALTDASSAARTSLATTPIFGRSSAGRAPMPRKISVMAPRFPRSDEPSSSSSAVDAAAEMRVAASACSVRSCFSSAARSTTADRAD